MPVVVDLRAPPMTRTIDVLVTVAGGVLPLDVAGPVQVPHRAGHRVRAVVDTPLARRIDTHVTALLRAPLSHPLRRLPQHPRR